jgi:hypothetical protein
LNEPLTGEKPEAGVQPDPGGPSLHPDTGTGPRHAATTKGPVRPPLWFEYLVLAGGCGVLSFGGFGLLLAVIGRYSGPLALLLGALGTVAGVLLGRPRRSGSAAASPTHLATAPAVAMCLVAGGIAVWNSIYIGHHVAVDNDPGVYATTGRWLASHDSLVVAASAPWVHTGVKLSFASAGIYQQPNGTVQFQFVHLLPALLAEAYKIGGAGLMFRTPAVLGAIGLLAVYLVGCRLVQRPWVVVAAVTGLGISLPELAVTRDTFSEPATQVLLWLAIWFLMRSYEERRFPVALVAGLAVGGTLMTHIDAVVYLVPIAPLATLAWLAAPSRLDRRSLLRMYAGVLIGIVPPALLGTFDVQRRAGTYYDALHPDIHHLYEGLALSVVIAVVVLVLWPPVTRLLPALAARRRQIGVLAGWIVGLGLALAWALRPAGPRAKGAVSSVVLQLQRAESLPIEPTRTYSEQSMLWIQWYIGPVALALAIAGLCLLTFRTIARGSARSAVLLAMTGPITALYLWDPSVTPYQIWVTRRYVPAGLPLLVIAAAVALDAAVTLCAARLARSAWPRRTLLVGAAGLIAFPLAATVPVREFQPQGNYLPLIDQTCQKIGPHAAVLFPPADYDGDVLSQTLRSWCNVPTAQLVAPMTAQQVQVAVAELGAEGRTLWVFGAGPAAITDAVPGVDPTLLGTATSPFNIQPTLTQPADAYMTTQLLIYGAEVTS